MDLIGGLSDGVDDHVHRTGGRTDLGEMAQMGAAESLSRLLDERTKTLFGSSPENVQRQLSKLGTPQNFSYLAREFFARLTERYVAYFLSRELSIQLGSVSANHQFREALSLHCRQASKIVETYAAEWYSKANYQGGISVKKASEFARYALNKLRAELQMGAGN